MPDATPRKTTRRRRTTRTTTSQKIQGWVIGYGEYGIASGEGKFFAPDTKVEDLTAYVVQLAENNGSYDADNLQNQLDEGNIGIFVVKANGELECASVHVEANPQVSIKPPSGHSV
jgi:hypothetical protein